MCEYAAFLFEAMNQKDVAERILRFVHDADQTHVSTIEVLGDLLESEGRFEEAHRLYSGLPGLCVKKSGGSLLDAGSSVNGEPDELFANLVPNTHQARPLTRLARLYERKRRRDAALQLLDVALECDPQCIPALLLKAELDALSGRPLLSKPLLLTAIDSKPSPPEAMAAFLALANLHAEHAGDELTTAMSAASNEVWSLEQADSLFQRACEVRVSLDSSVRGHHLVALMRMHAGARTGSHWKPMVEYAAFQHRYLKSPDSVDALCR